MSGYQGSELEKYNKKYSSITYFKYISYGNVLKKLDSNTESEKTTTAITQILTY